MARKPQERPNLWFHETIARSHGHNLIAGVDEAGRGPLAGPVVAAAVALPPECDIDGIFDSKQLSEKQRESAYEKIKTLALAIGVGIVDATEIDRINILQATFVAMRTAITNLGLPPDICLIDGDKLVPRLQSRQLSIIGGDGKSASIAAASIIAKVTRDRMMYEFDQQFPQYGFARHKGYGTKEHLEMLAEHGPCEIHRRSFNPVAQQAFIVREGELLERGDGAAASRRVFRTQTDMGKDRVMLGARGEERAARHLQSVGYRLVECNYRCPGGEIDIIARDGDDIVFVEVKTRRNDRCGTPMEAVNTRKRRRLVRAATRYLFEHQLDDCGCRFDVVSVSLADGRPADIEVTKGAFSADE